jgi:hypothetical protein
MLYSDSLYSLELVKEVKVTCTGNYYLSIIPNRVNGRTVEVVMKESDMVALRKQIDKVLKQPRPVTDEAVARLEKTFLFDVPYIISFAYRRPQFREDKPLLAKLLADGKIKQIKKDQQQIVYQYIIK